MDSHCGEYLRTRSWYLVLRCLTDQRTHTLRYVMKRRYKDKDMKESTLLFVVCIALIPVDEEAAESVDAAVPLPPPVDAAKNEEKADKGDSGFVDDDID